MPVALAEFQQSFIDRFLSPTSARWHALCASPGTGKTTTALEIAERVYKSDANSMILFLAPSVLASHAADILQTRVSATDGFYFSRQRIREVAHGGAASNWPTRIVTIDDNVAKQPEVFEKLRSVKWDLVIVDEAHRNLDFIERLLPELSDARVLLLTASASLPAGQLSSSFNVTQWRADELRVRISASETPIYYERSGEEKTVLERVASLAAELKENDEARLFLRIVRQAASSSFNALEQLLTRQLGVLRDVSAADSRLAGMPEDVVTRDLDLPVAVWKDSGAATKALLSTLDAIGKTSTDEKLAALFRLIEDLAKSRRRYGIWIVTSFRATAWYLNSSLSERGWRVNVLTADMPYSRALELSNILNQEQSILIATLASTKGVELPAVTHVVLYDEPRSPTAQHFIRARVPASSLLEVFAFREKQSI
jgi:hypothetical protein